MPFIPRKYPMIEHPNNDSKIITQPDGSLMDPSPGWMITYEIDSSKIVHTNLIQNLCHLMIQSG